MACKDLNRVIPELGLPVISVDTPKLLQHITKSLVTIKINFIMITNYLIRNTGSKHERKN